MDGWMDVWVIDSKQLNKDRLFACIYYDIYNYICRNNIPHISNIQATTVHVTINAKHTFAEL